MSHHPRRHRHSPILLALILASAAHTAWAQAPGGTLGGEEVRALITGNNFKGAQAGGQFVFVYYPDGKVYGTFGRRMDKGEWTIDGDKYCHDWTKLFDATKTCYEWSRKGDGYFLRNVDEYRTTNLTGKIRSGIPPGY